MYKSSYDSPLGKVLLSSDDKGLTGLWFYGQKYFAAGLKETVERETETITLAKKWLDIYFSGEKPGFNVPLHFTGTDFQNEVWEILYAIPYGKTVTYSDIAHRLAQRRGIPSMSAQAAGSAVGRNKISVIVPCHRVIGKNGSLTGYAGGIDKKISLLKLEGGWNDSFFSPKGSRHHTR